jgi:hypothetical protein
VLSRLSREPLINTGVSRPANSLKTCRQAPQGATASAESGVKTATARKDRRPPETAAATAARSAHRVSP